MQEVGKKRIFSSSIRSLGYYNEAVRVRVKNKYTVQLGNIWNNTWLKTLSRPPKSRETIL
jgi:hypothetical protein